MVEESIVQVQGVSLETNEDGLVEERAADGRERTVNVLDNVEDD